MASVGFQVIEGIEAGRIFRDLSTPVSIGREEENSIQLNDERISRFHAKIQDDSGRIILTDLESTNGTRVNGRPIRMRVLRPGDQISVGRCLLVFNSTTADKPEESIESRTLSDPDKFPPAFPHGAPPIPTNLAPVQTAEVSDVLDFVRTEILTALEGVSDLPKASEDDEATISTEPIKLSRDAIHRLHNVSGQIARYLKKLADPDSDV